MREAYARLILVVALLWPVMTSAQVATETDPSASSTALREKAELLPEIVNGGGDLDAHFATSFLAAVPAQQLRTICRDIVSTYGPPTGEASVREQRPNVALVDLPLRDAIASAEMVLDPGGSGQIVGLRFIGFTVRDDAYERVTADFSALPGKTAFLLTRLSDGRDVAALDPGAKMAVGSSFKLYVLAELAAQVASGARNWSDSIALGPASVPYSFVQDWPEDAPMTLQTLAALMIGHSDNRATDTLIAELGREHVEARMRAIGLDNADRALPLLTVTETFALKMPDRTALRERYLAADEAGQARLVGNEITKLTAGDVDPANLATQPRHIDTVEWFASPQDMARLLGELHASRDPVVRQLLSINRGISPGDAARWDYLGYKGGSEPGVIAMNFVGQAKSGQWYALSAAWNDIDKPVDKTRFAMLVSRLLNLAARE